MSENSLSGRELAQITCLTSLYLGFCVSSCTFVRLFLNVYKAIRDSLKETIASMQSIAVLLEPEMKCLLLVCHTYTHTLFLTDSKLLCPPVQLEPWELSVALSFLLLSLQARRMSLYACPQGQGNPCATSFLQFWQWASPLSFHL